MKQYDYNKQAKYYDSIELGSEETYEKLNDFLSRIFREKKVKTVLDITCGTGAQAIGLKKRGFKVTASDINLGMLKIARKKSKGKGIKFYKGDIRNSKFGEFDAVISIFNAIGHLSKKDFEKAIRNVRSNLKEGGIYIFDIFNLDFMKKNWVNHEFLDVARETKGIKFVRFNKNILDLKKGLMKINQKTIIQEGLKKQQIFREKWEMQIYTSKQLKELLERNGFKKVKFFNPLVGKSSGKGLSLLAVAERK